MTTDTLLLNVTTEALANVNLLTVVFLMCVGFLIKHWSLLDKIENDLIVPVLLVTSFAVTFVQNGFTMTMDTSLIALCTAVTAIGLHQSGKNIFTVTIIPKVKELIETTFVPTLLKWLSTKTTKLEENNKEENNNVE